MKTQGRIALLAALTACLVLPAAWSQSTQPAQNQQTPPDQNQSQYSGVSHPPSDSTIQADEDAPPPVVAPAPKPSAAIPMTTAAPAVAPAPEAGTEPAAAPSNPLDNTDYGIVTVVPAKHPSSADDASLQMRGWNSSDGIVNYVPSAPNELAPGTNITIRLSEALSTSDTQRGQTFGGVVSGNVYKDGRIIIPAGSGIRGRVVEVSQGHHIGSHATLRLRPDQIVLPDGTMYHIDAELVQSLADGTRTNVEGGIEPTHHFAKDALEYGAGTGVGAVAGAEIAGPVGAGVGSVVGAGLVSAHMLIGHPEAASLPQGSMLVFSLTEPMSMTPTRD